MAMSVFAYLYMQVKSKVFSVQNVYSLQPWLPHVPKASFPCRYSIEASLIILLFPGRTQKEKLKRKYKFFKKIRALFNENILKELYLQFQIILNNEIEVWESKESGKPFISYILIHY